MTKDTESTSEDLRTRRQQRLQKICRWILCAQFLAAPLLCVPDILPAVIGVGSISVAVEFRYLTSILIGSSAALLLFLPFMLAWSSKPMRWRAFVSTSFLVVAGVTSVVFGLISFFGTWQFAQISAFDLVRELSRPVGFALIMCCGIACVPVALRAYSGWQIAEVVESPKPVSRRDRLSEAILLAVLAGVIFLGGPFVDDRTGIGVLSGIFGIAVGGLLAVSVFWLFCDSNPVVFRIVLALNLILFVAVPVLCLWLADFVRIGLLPAGSGSYFLGVAAVATLSLVHVFLFRAMGFRMQQLPFEKVAAVPTADVIIDPFSD